MEHEEFSQSKAGYQRLCEHLMSALHNELKGSKFSDKPSDAWLYKQLDLPKGQCVKFTKWGPVESKKLFFLILCTSSNESSKVLEFDISNVILRDNRFTWYLRPPVNQISNEFLRTELGETVKTDLHYREEVKKNKRLLNSGDNTLINSHEFLPRSSLRELTEQFCRLVRLTFDWHEMKYMAIAGDENDNSSAGGIVGSDVSIDIENDDLSSYFLHRARIRLHQGPFKKGLMKRYGGKCVVTNCAIEQLLIAAHIQDHASCGINDLDNGLLLKTDIHTLYDAGLITIGVNKASPKNSLLVTVVAALQSDPIYNDLHNKVIIFDSPKLMPKKKYLNWKINKHKK